jgi:hypothetical protein
MEGKPINTADIANRHHQLQTRSPLRGSGNPVRERIRMLQAANPFIEYVPEPEDEELPKKKKDSFDFINDWRE